MFETCWLPLFAVELPYWDSPIEMTPPVEMTPISCPAGRVQPTVTFPIGDHVNVLHDYKKTGPSKILKLLSCRCHHLNDRHDGRVLSKSHISNSFKTAERAIPVNIYQFLHKLLRTRALWRINCQKSFRQFKSSKNPWLHF